MPGPFPTFPRTGGSLVEHRAVMREVVNSTPAGPTLMVNNWVESAAFVIKISKWLDFQVFSDKDDKP